MNSQDQIPVRQPVILFFCGLDLVSRESLNRISHPPCSELNDNKNFKLSWELSLSHGDCTTPIRTYGWPALHQGQIFHWANSVVFQYLVQSSWVYLWKRQTMGQVILRHLNHFNLDHQKLDQNKARPKGCSYCGSNSYNRSICIIGPDGHGPYGKTRWQPPRRVVLAHFVLVNHNYLG